MGVIMAQAAGAAAARLQSDVVGCHRNALADVHVSAIIAAGGRGARLGAGQPKQLLALGGVPILQRSVDALLAHAQVHDLVVALPPELAAAPPPYLLGAEQAGRRWSKAAPGARTRWRTRSRACRRTPTWS